MTTTRGGGFLKSIKKQAGFKIEDDIDFLDFVSLIDIPRESRFSVLDAYLNKLRQKIDGHLIVILDVVTDCVEDFNNPRKSMELIDMMNRMINEHDLSFFCVIHENPQGGDKARGHLGTELNNKSSATLQIKFEGENSNVLKVTLLKGRSIKSGQSFYVTYSEEHKTLVLAEQSQVKAAIESRQVKAPIEEVKQKLLELLKEPASKASLIKYLKEYFKCGNRVIEERLKALLTEDVPLIDEEGNQFSLDSYKEGRSVFYGLAPYEEKPA